MFARMRLLVLSALISLSAVAAPRKPVTAILPPGTDGEGAASLALLINARASELVEETDKVNELHLKQVLRTVTEENFSADLNVPENAEALRKALGADRVVRVVLSQKKGAWGLSIRATDAKGSKVIEKNVSEKWPEAIEEGSRLIALAMVPGAKFPKNSATQPTSKNEAALKLAGECYAVVIRQPVSADTPALIDSTELEAAVAKCDQAVKLDPLLHFAAATASLGHAILGTDASAAQALSALQTSDEMLELSMLARFWLLTRYQSNEAGVAYLKQQIAKHPGELLARAYLGDTQFVLGAWADSEKTWREYLEVAPDNAWAWGRLSKSLARQGKHDEAIAAAKKAFVVSPSSPEARLELGSRFIDAGKLPEAIEILEPLSKVEAPRGEHLLRLGWAHWLKGELAPAQAYFQRGYDVATAPGDWRTRGRAAYDLALVEMKRGNKKAAIAAFKTSQATGYRVRDLDPSIKPLTLELERAELMGDAGVPVPDDSARRRREASLFPLDSFGEPNVKAPKEAPPNGLVLFRF